MDVSFRKNFNLILAVCALLAACNIVVNPDKNKLATLDDDGSMPMDGDMPDAGDDGSVTMCTPVDCNDNNLCTKDTCNVSDYTCKHDPIDEDQDGYAAKVINATMCSGNDCNDKDKNIHPSATEKCDGIDSNCNGVADASDSCAGDSCEKPLAIELAPKAGMTGVYTAEFVGNFTNVGNQFENVCNGSAASVGQPDFLLAIQSPRAKVGGKDACFFLAQLDETAAGTNAHINFNIRVASCANITDENPCGEYPALWNQGTKVNAPDTVYIAIDAASLADATKGFKVELKIADCLN